MLADAATYAQAIENVHRAAFDDLHHALKTALRPFDGPDDELDAYAQNVARSVAEKEHLIPAYEMEEALIAFLAACYVDAYTSFSEAWRHGELSGEYA